MVYLSNDLVNYDQLAKIYKFCPLEATRFEKYFEAVLNHGFVEYIYSIKSKVEDLDISSDTLQSQIDKFARKAHQDSIYYKYKINSFKTEKNVGNKSRKIIVEHDDKVIFELH